jgi:hypothetical protein
MMRRTSRSIVKALASPVPMRVPALAAPVPMRVPAPAPASPVPAPAAKSSTGSLVKDGFAWGLGNGMAHALVSSIVRPSAASAAPVAAAQGSPEYVQCRKDFEDQAACKHLLPKEK